MGEITVDVDARPFLAEARAKYADPATSGITMTGCPCAGGRPTSAALTAEGASCECGRAFARWVGAPWEGTFEVANAPVLLSSGDRSGKTAERHRAIGQAVSEGKSVYIVGIDRAVMVRPDVVFADAPPPTGGLVRVDPDDGRGPVAVVAAPGDSPAQVAEGVVAALGRRPSETCMLCTLPAAPPRAVCEACDAALGDEGEPLSRGAYDELAARAKAALDAVRMGCAPAPWCRGSRGPVLACGNHAFFGDAVRALEAANLGWEEIDLKRHLLRVLPAVAPVGVPMTALRQLEKGQVVVWGKDVAPKAGAADEPEHRSSSGFVGWSPGPSLAEALFGVVPRANREALAAFPAPPWPAWCAWDRDDPYMARRIDAIDLAAGHEVPSRSLAEARKRGTLALWRLCLREGAVRGQIGWLRAALAEAKAPGGGL